MKTSFLFPGHRRSSGRTARGPSTRRGFTLVELLVVIAILALLLTLLMPVLWRARELTRRVICASHIAALCKASNQYGSENRDRLPPLHDAVSPYWLQLVPNKTLEQKKSEKILDRETFQEQYSLERDHFYCPSNEKGWNIDYLYWWDKGDRQTAFASVIGYTYLGGNSKLSGKVQANGTRGGLGVSYMETLPATPVHVLPVYTSQDSVYKVIWTDLARKTPENSWFLPDRRGVNHYDGNECEGMNSGLVDTSVIWMTWPQYNNAVNNGGWLTFF